MENPSFPVEWLSLPDYELGIHALAYFMGISCDGLGVPRGSATEELAEVLRKCALRLDTEFVDFVGLEKALKLVASDDVSKGGHLFRQWALSRVVSEATLEEAITGKGRQKEKAKRPRADKLQKLIQEIVKDDSGITTFGVLTQLEQRRGQGIIYSVDNEEVCWWVRKKGERNDEDEGETRITPVSGLKDRVSKAKKKVHEI